MKFFLLTFIFGLALMATNTFAQDQKMYWLANEKLQRADTNGQNLETLYEIEFGDPRDIVVDSKGAKVYWTDSDGYIRRANTDGSSFEILFPGPSASFLNLDPAHGKMYWVSGLQILRANLDGSQLEILSQYTETYGFSGFALDALNQTIYWTARNSNEFTDQTRHLSRASLNSSTEEILIPSMEYLLQVVVDSEGEKLYLVKSPPVPSIGRVFQANLDGTNLNGLLDFQYSFSLSFNSVERKLYWTNSAQIFRAEPDASNPELLLNHLYLYAGKLGFDDANQKLYFSSGAVIQRTDLNGDFPENFAAAEMRSPISISIDPESSKLYWLDYGLKKIKRTQLDFSNPEVILSIVPEARPSAFALDLSNQKIYWSQIKFFEDNESGYLITLLRANFDGSSIEEIVSEFPGEITSIAVDPFSSRVFWVTYACCNSPASKIWSSNTDGSDIQLVTTVEGNFGIRDLYIDAKDQHLYWFHADYNNLRIERLALTDNASVETILDAFSGAGSISGISLNFGDRKIYWTDSYSGTVRKANFDGSNIQIASSGGEFGYINIQPIFVNAAPATSSSTPNACSINAQQPHEIQDANLRHGWDSLDLQFSNYLPSTNLELFSLSQFGSNQPAPEIISATRMGLDSVHLTLSEPIRAGAWTCIEYGDNNICLGALPGDVNADGQVNPSDILNLINSLNGQSNYPIWQTDMNLSGTAEPSDILRLVDLLNGAAAFVPWNGAALSVCPSN